MVGWERDVWIVRGSPVLPSKIGIMDGARGK